MGVPIFLNPRFRTKCIAAFFIIIFLTLFINTSTIVYAADVLLTSYDYSNRSTWQGLKNFHPSATTAYSAVMESFRTPDDGVNYVLKAVNFSLYRVGTPIGDAYAKLYAHSGTFGTSSVPTGSPLATSLPLNVTTLPTAYVNGVDTTINFTDGYTMTANTTYCLTFENPASGTIDNSNYVQAGVDATSPTYEGNYASYRSSAWTANSAADLACFAVWGEAGEQGQDLSFQMNETINITSANSNEKEIFKPTSESASSTAVFGFSMEKQFVNIDLTQIADFFFTQTETLIQNIEKTFADLITGIGNMSYSRETDLNPTESITSNWLTQQTKEFQIGTTELATLATITGMGIEEFTGIFTFIETLTITDTFSKIRESTVAVVSNPGLVLGIFGCMAAFLALALVVTRKRRHEP